MAQTINTNVASLNAQRNLTSSQGSLATSLQRLSSGLRINSAKDDAAGMAISERFNTQIRGINQAVRNANDGISLSQTAEGAMNEIGNNLQRIRELAVQSRNATNSDTDREALNKEVAQLKEEISRVANQTEFNGTKLLDGSFTEQAFQVGANYGETINIAKIANANIDQLGTYQSVEVAGAAIVDSAAAAGFAQIDAGTIKINGEELGQLDAVTGAAGDGATREAAVVSAINAISGKTGVTAAINSTTNAIELTSADGRAIKIEGAVVGTSGLTDGTYTTTTNGVDNTGFDDLDISTVEGADKALLQMDAALTAINSARADMGAVQNRFSSVIANLQTTSENLSASRGRIVDADFATETANLTRSQILQQAGTAMLAQANGLPQNVLSLLRG